MDSGRLNTLMQAIQKEREKKFLSMLKISTRKEMIAYFEKGNEKLTMEDLKHLSKEAQVDYKKAIERIKGNKKKIIKT